jgi:hypothetical protein
MSQRKLSRPLALPVFCPRCGATTEHVRGICRTCDPCTAAILASVRVQPEPEARGQPDERAAALMRRPAGEVEMTS